MLEATKVNLDNGIPLYYIKAGKQPVMRLEIIFMAGKWYESQPGLSYFTGKTITEGTLSYSARQIASLFDQLGAFVEITPGFDRVTLTIHLLTRHLPAILPIMKEIITSPTFRKPELENIKKRKRQQLLVDLEKNSFVAARNFTKKIFGENHPYGRILNLENIDDFETEMVGTYFWNNFKGNYEIIISGKVGEKEIQLINEYLTKDPVKPGSSTESFSIKYRPSTYYEEKEGSLQSSIRIGMPFIHRRHQDYLDMVIVNEILGGYFGSRLMRNIREDKGFTYGIRSGISNLKHAGFWSVSTEVKKQYRDQTINEIHKEIQLLKQTPVSEEELETVKNYMSGTFISAIDTPFALADKFKTIHYSGLDYDYYERYFQSINNITAERIQELSRKYLIKEQMTTVIVG